MKKIIYSILILNILGACSTKKAGITQRTYHRITTWYNTVFNGEEALNKELEAKEASYRDNFSTILQIDPIDPFTNEQASGMNSNLQGTGRTTSSLSGDLKDNIKKLDAQGTINSLSGAVDKLMGAGNTSQAQGYDKAIEKGKTAIEKHSMLIKGKDYNSMMSEAYLLLGRAYYYKRDPFEALNYLNYMNSTLVKNRKNVLAQGYMALAQAQAGNSFQANEIYEKLLKEKLKKRDGKFISKIYAQFLIDEKKYKEAVEALNTTKKYNKGKYNLGRYSFIQGQLSEKLKKEDEAIKYYNIAYNKKPAAELEIKSQIALSRLYKKEDSSAYHERIKFLKKLTKKGLYQSRKNELFYAMALTSLKDKREKEAMKYLLQSLKEKESDPQVRALTYQDIGDIYFSKQDYIYASTYYDSAISRFIDPVMKNKLISKNKSLIEITKKYYLVKKNDSILAVAAMTTEQRNEYYQKYINKLKKTEEKASLELEKQLQRENNTVFATEASVGSGSFVISTPNIKNKWYFYNTTLKQAGQSEFRKQWGDRALMDNWRISRQMSGMGDMKNQLLGQKESKNPRRFEVEYYVEKLPKTQSELQVLKKQRDTAELSLAIMYYDKLHDVKSSTSTLEHLLSTPPYNEEVALSAMYNIYRINKEENSDLSKKYADLVVTKYPNSNYAESIQNPQIDIFKTKSPQSVIFYEQAYKKYEEGKYNEVKEMAAQALLKYPTDQIIAKFSLLSAFCDAKLGNKEAFLESLERVAIIFEDKEEGKKAAELVKYFKEKEKKGISPKELEKKNNFSSEKVLQNP